MKEYLYFCWALPALICIEIAYKIYSFAQKYRV